MKFVKLQVEDFHDNTWWLWEIDTMHLVNFFGGGFKIDENEDYWLTAECYEYDSWHDLFVQTGFNPFEHGETYYMHGWIDPDGIIWKCDAHEADADLITKLYYDKEFEYFGHNNAATYLIEHGWVKITRGAMWKWYTQDTHIQYVSAKTYATAVKYCLEHDIEHPKHLSIKK